MQPPLSASHPIPTGGALYPEECNLIAALQRLVDQGKAVAGDMVAGDGAGRDPRAQLAKIFNAFGG